MNEDREQARAERESRVRRRRNINELMDRILQVVLAGPFPGEGMEARLLINPETVKDAEGIRQIEGWCGYWSIRDEYTIGGIPWEEDPSVAFARVEIFALPPEPKPPLAVRIREGLAAKLRQWAERIEE
jgi:hypothetical protein